MEITPPSVETLLKFIPADVDRDIWWRVGAAIKSIEGESGFKTFDEWSQKCEKKYSAADTKDVWNSYTRAKKRAIHS